jgi:hypothetical protein
VFSTGCALFPNFALTRLADEQFPAETTEPAATQDAVAIQIYFVERPAGDLLVGDSLWNELDQIANVPAETRDRLHRNGLRFGLSGSSPPYALRAVTEASRDQTPGRQTLSQRYEMPSGVTHQFPCGSLPESVTLLIDDPAGTREKAYSSAQGVFRCRVERTQGGWARVEILPEIHHGLERMRPLPGEQQWDWGGGQEVDPLHGQRFSVDLNEGEYLVLGATGADSHTIGANLLRGEHDETPIEKLIVLRLEALKTVSAVTQSRTIRGQ